MGKLKKCGIHWDKLGNSRGTAEVEFETIEEAKQAIEKYHNFDTGKGNSIYVQFARRRIPRSKFTFRKGGLRLGRRMKLRKGKLNNEPNTNQGIEIDKQ